MGRGSQIIKFGEIMLSSDTESMDRLVLHLNTLLKKYGYPSDRKIEEESNDAVGDTPFEEAVEESPKPYVGRPRVNENHFAIPVVPTNKAVSADEDGDGIPESEEFLGDESLDEMNAVLGDGDEYVGDSEEFVEEASKAESVPKWIRGKARK